MQTEKELSHILQNSSITLDSSNELQKIKKEFTDDASFINDSMQEIRQEDWIDPHKNETEKKTPNSRGIIEKINKNNNKCSQSLEIIDTCCKNVERVDIKVDKSATDTISISDEEETKSNEDLPELIVEGQKSFDNTDNVINPDERTIIKPFYFIQEFLKICSKEAHEPFNCTASNMKCTGMTRRGLRQVYYFICNFCNRNFTIYSEPKNNDYMDINTCAVAATKSSGTDYIELEEHLSYMGIQCMPEKTYEISKSVNTANVKIAEEEMKIAGEDECKIAEAANLREGKHFICPIKIDGTWCTRSYGSQGRSKAGAVIVVGKSTNKILFFGSRNKNCIIHTRAKNQNKEPKPHQCFKNWSEDQSACAMESDIAVEGFMKSIECHNLVYSTIIGDDDSSMYSKVLAADPYEGVFIEKRNCVNHLLRNMGKQLKKIAKMRLGKKGTDCKISLKRNICRIRFDIQEAAIYRMSEENFTFEQKVTNLQKDIRNVPYHVFGEHSNCAQYFCDGLPKKNEVNMVEDMIALGLFQRITNLLDELSFQAESILNYDNTNIVESINSIISKLINAKRKNKTQRGSYHAAVAQAVIHFNTRRAGSKLNEYFGYITPTTLITMENRRIKKNEYNVIKLRENKKKRKYEVICSDDDDENNEDQVPMVVEKKKQSTGNGKKDYGKNCQKPDISDEEFKSRVNCHYESLQKRQQNSDILELCTRKKMNTTKTRFIVEKHILMDRFFSEICRMRAKTSGITTIDKILSPTIRKIVLDKYEEKGKIAVKNELEGNEQMIKKCGLFLHKEIPYLGALPDGITSTLAEDDTVVIIECPYNAKEWTPEEAIKRNIGKITAIFDKKAEGLNQNHAIFYRLIGAMEIAEKNYGLFVLWTPKGMRSVLVERDKQFWKNKMESYLIDFYEQKLIPEIVDSRKNRNMEIREKMDKNVLSYTSFCENQKKQSDVGSKSKEINKNEDTNSNKSKNNKKTEFQSNDRSDNNLSDELCFSVGDITEENINIISNNEWLNTDHMEYFAKTMKEVSNGYYDPEYTTKIQAPQRIRTMCPVKSHIQILNRSGIHWVCSYYDTEKIYIYDSQNNKRTAPDEKIFLQCMYPHFDFDNHPIIRPEVQHQSDGYNCGVYAIAFAISLMHGLRLDEIRYNATKIRQHLLKILTNKKIEHFPLADTHKHIIIPTLKETLTNEKNSSEISHAINLKNEECLCNNTNKHKSELKNNLNNVIDTIVIN